MLQSTPFCTILAAIVAILIATTLTTNTIFSIQAKHETLPWVAEKRTDAISVKRHELLLNITEQFASSEKVVFIGASQVQHWLEDGKPVWDKYYVPRHAYNYGVSGDMTQHMLWRIENGELDNITAKLVVFQPGSNNMAHHDKPVDNRRGVEAVIKAIKGKIPHTKIILVSILPREHFMPAVKLINDELIKLPDNNTVYWLDLVPFFETEPGVQNTTLFIHDNIHPTEEGYEIWHRQMEPLFVKLLEE